MSAEVIKKWHGNEVLVKMNNVVKKSILDIGLAIQAQAVELCQVDSGNLRGSIQVQTRDQKIDSPNVADYKEGTEIEKPTEKNIAHVGSACVYAAAQEFGLAPYGKPAYQFHPYLRPAKDLVDGKALTLVEYNGRAEFKEYLQE